MPKMELNKTHLLLGFRQELQILDVIIVSSSIIVILDTIQVTVNISRVLFVCVKYISVYSIIEDTPFIVITKFRTILGIMNG